MAIATNYNPTHHNGGGSSDGSSMTVRTSLDHVSPLTNHRGRRPSLLATGSADGCDACPHCDDVCDKEGCLSCHEKLRKRCPSPGCGGEPTFTMCQIRRHQSTDSAWLIAGGYVYDATTYIAMHPGGDRSILRKCGGACDCTEDLKFHSVKGQKLWKKYRVGRVRSCCQEDDKTWWMFWK